MKYPTNDAVINTVPAAHELRKVANFNPLKFLRRTTSEENGEKRLKLDLRYKRLWFRLACPNGRMVVKPLSITDQMAVFEALVYAEKADAEPLAQVTAWANAADVPDGNFIDDAKEKALNEALENAGFGIQLCDLVQTAGGTRYGSEIPLSKTAAAQNGVLQVQSAQTQVVHREKNPPIHKEDMPPKPQAVHPTQAVRKPVAAEAEPVVPNIVEPVKPEVNEAPVSEPVELPVEQPQVNTMQTVREEETARPGTAPSEDGNVAENAFCGSATAADTHVVPSSAQSGSERPKQAVSGQNAAGQPSELVAKASYTEDMPVEEICERMTLEDARAFVVENGICKGWTLAQVAEQRAPSLRFYMCANNASNVMKAAARLVFNDMELRKAG